MFDFKFYLSALFGRPPAPRKMVPEAMVPWACGETEQRLEDGTRCDCVTTTHAIEFDFGKKWYEAVGQSLHYSLVTGKKAGIVLILESPKDRKYWNRLKHVIKKYDLPIRVWTMGPGNVNSIKK